MLLVASALKGYAIEASDGRIGTVSDLLLDDSSWKLRWLVVDTGTWLSDRKVLLHPSAIGQPDHERRALPVNLTTHQVEASPGSMTDRPVSQQMESNLYRYYGWDPMWGGSSYFGTGGIASPISAPPLFGADARDAATGDTLLDEGDPHLRSVAEITGYHIAATDGEVGHVENLLIDDVTWSVRYIIVDTKNWWPGKHVLLSPYAVSKIEWGVREVGVDVSKEKVRESPPWDPAAIIDQYYEKRLHTHYGWPGYGW